MVNDKEDQRIRAEVARRVRANVRANRIAELEAELADVRDDVAGLETSLAWTRKQNAALEAALDAWLDWDRTAETDTSGAILERARELTERARS